MSVFYLVIVACLIHTSIFAESVVAPKVIKLGFVDQKRTLSYLPSMKDKQIDKSFELAIGEFNASNFAKAKKIKVEVTTFDVGEKKLDVQSAFDKAVKSDVIAVVGLTTSREALLVGEMAQENKILTISTAGGHDKIGNFGDYVYSHSGAMASYGRLMGDYVIGQKPKRVLLISNSDEPYSKGYADAIQGIVDGQVDLKRIDIPSHQLLNEDQLAQLQTEWFDLIVLTLYTYQGVLTLNSLNDYGIIHGAHVLVSPSWSYDQLAIQKNLKEPQKIICYASWSDSWKDPMSQAFITKFGKIYGYKPGTSDALAYDVANEIFAALRATNEYTREGLKLAHDKIKNYRGVIGWYDYGNCGGHPRVNYFLLELNSQKRFVLKSVKPVPKRKSCDG